MGNATTSSGLTACSQRESLECLNSVLHLWVFAAIGLIDSIGSNKYAQGVLSPPDNTVHGRKRHNIVDGSCRGACRKIIWHWGQECRGVVPCSNRLSFWFALQNLLQLLADCLCASLIQIARYPNWFMLINMYGGITRYRQMFLIPPTSPSPGGIFKPYWNNG